jgi:hypothetical protein
MITRKTVKRLAEQGLITEEEKERLLELLGEKSKPKGSNHV